MLPHEVIKKIIQVADKMVDRMSAVSSGTEETYREYKLKFGEDQLTKEYDSLCLLLSECPIMVD